MDGRFQRLLRPAGLFGFVVFLIVLAYRVLDFWGNMDFLNERLPAIAGFLGSVWGWLSVTGFSVLLIVWALSRTPPAQVKQLPVQKPDAPKGFSDFLVEAQKAPTQLLKTTKRIGDETARIGVRVAKHTKRIEGKKGDPEAIRRIALDAAGDMDRFSAFLERESASLGIYSSTFLENWLGYFSSVSADAYRAQGPQALRFREVVSDLLKKVVEYQGTMGGFRNAVMGLRRANVSQALNQATDRLEKPLNRLLDVTKDMQANLRQLLRVIDKKLKESVMR